MLHRVSQCIAYGADSAAAMQLTMCGIRAPQEPFAQKRRCRDDFVVFLQIKGEIELIDEMPDAVERVRVRPGEIHLVAPGVWQASAVPFPPGIVFLWFHFTCGKTVAMDAAKVDATVRGHLNRAPGAVTQPRWLFPRHLDLGENLEDLTRAHAELMENERLWGIHDQGTQALGRALLYRFHRSFVRSRQLGSQFTKTSPEEAHVGRAKIFIRLHHEQPIALAEVAAAVGLNPAYLSRCFHRVTGQTVGAALLDARIATAKRLLAGGHSVKSVAFQAGFGSASYFCRQFKRVVKRTPYDYFRRRKYDGQRWA